MRCACRILLPLLLIILFTSCSAFPTERPIYNNTPSPFILVILSDVSWKGRINNLSIGGQPGRHVYYINQNICWIVNKVRSEGHIKSMVTTFDFEAVTNPIEIVPMESSEPYGVVRGCFTYKK